MVADEAIRQRLRPLLDAVAGHLQQVGVRATHVTVAGLLLAIGAAVAVGLRAWWLGLALWLVSRLADGVDGVLARRDGADTDLGGFLDLLADFLAYGGFVVGVAVALPEARVACTVLLLAYYLNGSAFLALSSLAERRRQTIATGDRSLQFVGGLAEGFETIVAHALMALLGALAPSGVVVVVWVFAGMVLVTVLQRVVAGVRFLRRS